MPGVVEEYVREQAQNQAEDRVAEYAGGRYEGIGADVYDYARDERERSPSASVREVYEIAAARLINAIRAYDGVAYDSEFQSEARAIREGIHIDQFHARYESPGENASEYQQNLHSDLSVDFVEKQLREVDRQLPNATEIEKLQMTESKRGLGHERSERLLAQYGYNTGKVAERENVHGPSVKL